MSLNELFDAQNMSQEDAYQYISLLFDGYLARKRKKELYKENDPIPRIIIQTYYYFVDDPRFDKMFSSFKRKYIVNENNLEQVHNAKERQGLGIIYDYIQNYIPDNNLNLFIILKLHKLLFSKVDYPEFGGSFRKHNVYLPGSGVNLSNYDCIASDMTKLYLDSLPLFKMGLEIAKSKDSSKLIPYINECIKLNAEIIRIHPFGDGNGRVSRALTNLMFKLVDIPPVYVKVSERNEYGKAMNKALAENDINDLTTFYYYKICDSIIDLEKEYKKGINLNKKEGKKLILTNKDDKPKND